MSDSSEDDLHRQDEFDITPGLGVTGAGQGIQAAFDIDDHDGAGWDELLAKARTSHAFAYGALLGYKCKVGALLDPDNDDLNMPFSISVPVIQ
jgi:hypothetical protein